jgi:hypothetical protein
METLISQVLRHAQTSVINCRFEKRKSAISLGVAERQLSSQSLWMTLCIQ